MPEQQHQPAHAEQQGGAAHEEQQTQTERTQRSVVGAATPPNLLSGGGALALQRSLGNRAVQSMVQRRPGPPIQREIYVERAKLSPARMASSHYHKTSSSHDDGEGDLNVQSMLTDKPKRYFASKAEMRNFANKQTTTMGYVEKANAWVRLPNTFMVLGENHKQTTLADLVKATGTDKFMYEPYTELPQGLGQQEPLAAMLQNRENEINTKAGIPQGGDGGMDHHAEAFYPKMLRGIAGINVRYDFEINGDSQDAMFFRMAILAVARLNAQDPSVFPTYNANHQLFDTTADEIQRVKLSDSSLSRRMVSLKSADLFQNFVNEFEQYAATQAQAERAAAPAKDSTDFDASWQKADKDYDNAQVMRAEKMRDFSLFQHMKRAKSGGYLLMSVGDLHRQRLAKLLDAEGITHMHMDTYIEQQKTAYPQ